MRVGKYGEIYDMPRGWKTDCIYKEKVYHMWKEMWRRVYTKLDYFGSLIYPPFKYFSNYYDWIINQPSFDDFCSTCKSIKWSINKDINGNKHYYPEYMSLILGGANTQEMLTRRGNPSQRKDISDKAHRKTRKPIIGISVKDNIIILLKSSSEAREKGFPHPSNIRNCLRGRIPYYKGYRWFYLDMNDRGD